MRLFALIGKSGTGKSYQAMFVAKRENIECIIDDGLLISNNKIIAGTSAKKEHTKIASVKHAIFLDNKYASEMKHAIKNFNPSSILILGTSEKMVHQISERLILPEFEKIFHIEEIATEEEIQRALVSRNRYGKHVIPVPTFEIKQDFSGYFLRSLKSIRKKVATGEITENEEKSIIRPTYSYLGEFTISDNVISEIIEFELKKLTFIGRIHSIIIDKLSNGIGVEIFVSICYGYDLQKAGEVIKMAAAYPVEEFTSINVEYVNVSFKGVVV